MSGRGESFAADISRYGHELEEFGSLLLMMLTVPMLWNLGKFLLK